MAEWNADYYRDAVKRYLKDNPSATVREVMVQFGLSSPSHAHRYVKQAKGIMQTPLREQLKVALQRIKELEKQLEEQQ